MSICRTWKVDRVLFFGDDGTLRSLPTAWTDAGEPDAFVTMAEGRSRLHVEDLLALAGMIDGLRRVGNSDQSVSTIPPPVLASIHRSGSGGPVVWLPNGAGGAE